MPKPALTLSNARKAIRWFQLRMGMQHWKVFFELGDEPPRWGIVAGEDNAVARCQVWDTYRTAYVWVSLSRCKAQDWDPWASLFHELLHIWGISHGFDTVQAPTPNDTEFAWNSLGGLLARAYRAGVH